MSSQYHIDLTVRLRLLIGAGLTDSTAVSIVLGISDSQVQAWLEGRLADLPHVHRLLTSYQSALRVVNAEQMKERLSGIIAPSEFTA